MVISYFRFFGILIFLLAQLAVLAQNVKRIKAEQQGKSIVVRYELECTEPCTISLFVSLDGGYSWKGPLQGVNGDEGKDVTGGSKKITWDVFSDLDELVSNSVKFKIDAEYKAKVLPVYIYSNTKGLFPSNSPFNSLGGASSFIKNQELPYGKFYFNVKQSRWSNSVADGISLVKYKTVGPEAVLLSALLPGLGTNKVTYGKKGTARMTYFLLAAGVGVFSKIYSDMQYNKYLGINSNQNESDQAYNTANTYHKLALVWGGVAASIYVYDLIWVFAKGCKNVKQTKNLRKKLKEGPIKIE